MFKKRIWLGIILSIILLVFSINGFTAYYKYTQESGTNFYVGIADKADALEDTNEMRQIIDDLGALLVHSKRDNEYPKNGLFGGTIQIPEAGLKFYNAPANGDIAAYIAGEMSWQTKVELGIDLTLYYLKTEIDTLSEVEAIYNENIICDDELTTIITNLKFRNLVDTPIAYEDGKYARSTADGVVWDDPAGVGDMTKAVYDTDADDIVDKAETVDDGVGNSSTAADIEDAVTKKHTQNTDTQFDFYNALADDHTWSGQKDTQPVGESVVFGDLLYFNWTDKEWKKTDADSNNMVPGLRIALESKADGQACLMLIKGYIRDNSAFEFAGSMVYTSVTPGAMSSTAPTETGDQVQRVGVAKSADILFFDPSIDVGEI